MIQKYLWVFIASLSALGEDLQARFALEASANRIGGSSAEVHNILGLVYLKGGDFVGAEKQFQLALSKWPQMIEAQVNLGNSFKGQRRYADAAAPLNKLYHNNLN